MKNTLIFIAGILIIVIAGVVAAGFYVLPKLFNANDGQIACTMEAMICPDGSAVGRMGPNCEFTKCPEIFLGPNFGEWIVLSISKPVQFSDGLTMVLNKINDSRCKPEVVCVWAGELSADINIAGGNVGSLGRQFTLGTSTKTTISLDGYTFTLKDASQTSATIMVSKKSQEAGPCYVGGCSGEICSDKEGMVSTCIYKEEYACYKTATCERQSTGQCGWTQTSALKACLGK